MPLSFPHPHHQQPASSLSRQTQTGRSSFPAAFYELATVVERYSPLHREKGINTFGGCDLIDHKEEGLPLSKVGVLVVAARKLRQWESIVGDAYKTRIAEEDEQIVDKGENALGLLMATRSQPTTKPPGETIDGSHMAEQHFSTPGTPESTAVVSKAYLQRLEMENHLYRRHLSTFENAVAQKWVAILMKGIDEAVKETNGDTAVETDGNTAIEMNGDIAVK